ncbi:MAG: diacylglycerol/lipid kinase family protein, partial [Christensenellaceae bacterium]
MYCIIVNPNAGKGKGKKNLKTVLKLFSERGAEYSVFETTRAGEAKEFSERLTSSGEQEIIVVGGDGTLHEVLNGLSDPSSCRLGLIPSGTGNDFSAAAGLPSNAAQAAEIILSGETKETDFLCVGGVRCMNVGGLGMDVDVLVRCKKGRFVKGKIKYLLSLLQSLFTFKGYEIEIESGERRETHKALIAVACNGTQIGGGIRICPASVIDDGKIDVMAVECMGKAQIVKAFLYLMKGK